MRTVAVIEDDPDLYRLLRYNLSGEGYRVVGSTTGDDALGFLRSMQPDLVLLDIMLPKADGLDVCKAVRRDPFLQGMPIIFLSARASETDRIVGLELGANDYVVKPFTVRELMARVRLQFRERPESQKRLSSGELELDRNRLVVQLRGHRLSLTPTEFRLLEFLMSRPDCVFSRSQLLEQVWGHGSEAAERAVDVCVRRLRRKLKDDPVNPSWIHSVRGFGYKFSAKPAAAWQ